jgi:dTDP-glucose 4,6-dehydratase
VVTTFINQALRKEPLTIYGDGSQTRSFQYVSDLVCGIERLMEVEYHQPVNLGNPEEYTILQFAEVVRDLINPKLTINYFPLTEDDPMQRKPDIQVAQSLLSWQPQRSLSYGLAKTVSYYKALRAQEVEEAERPLLYSSGD